MKNIITVFFVLLSALCIAATNNINRTPAPAIGYTANGTNYFVIPLGTWMQFGGEARSNWPTGGGSVDWSLNPSNAVLQAQIDARATTNGTYALLSCGTATVALSGWPTEWDYTTITNVPWIDSSTVTNIVTGIAPSLSVAYAETANNASNLVGYGNIVTNQGSGATLALRQYTTVKLPSVIEGAGSSNFIANAGAVSLGVGALSKARSFVFTDGSVPTTNAATSYSVFMLATNGFTLAGGSLSANGAGLTNIPAYGMRVTNSFGGATETIGDIGLFLTNLVGVGITVTRSGNTATLTGASVIPVALLPGAALVFGSTNNAYILGTSNAGTALSNNWDDLVFDSVIPQSATWQLMNPNSSGMTNVSIWIHVPQAATGTATNTVWQFGFAGAATNTVRPAVFTVLATWTNSIEAVSDGLSHMTATFATNIPVGPVWFVLYRVANDAADICNTNAYFTGGRVW